MLTPAEIIIKKRNGNPLSREEISCFIRQYLSGSIPEYQMSALLMAIYFKGMQDDEVGTLTKVYVQSGKQLTFTANTVDKHSTGGIGDKISLLLAPLVAECGGVIPMIAGRGLGHTGGTLDKLEAIPGFRTDLSEAQFRTVIDDIGFSIISQSAELVPADKQIYALRDVTGTVESLPLITASIISKKIAEGAKNLVIDLKIGSGAFMKESKTGRELGRLLKATGEALGQNVEIVYSNMNSPLGCYIGNALEVYETIRYLQGASIPDIDLLTRHLAIEMLVLAKHYANAGEAALAVENAISSGKALARFSRFITAQGGDAAICDNPQALLSAKHTVPIRANSTGWIQAIDCTSIGYSLLQINAGRKKLDSLLDYSTGAYLLPKVGDYIRSGDEIGKVYCNDPGQGKITASLIASSFTTVEDKTEKENILLAFA